MSISQITPPYSAAALHPPHRRSAAIWHDARLAPALAAALCAFLITAFAPQVFNDSDTYWHITAGQWMLSHGAVLHSDPFSFTAYGKPWHTQEWLAEILMALSFRAGGWAGVATLFGAAAAALAGLLAYHLGRWLGRLSLAVVLVVSLACVAGSLLARPHLLALPLLEIWAAGLVIARSENRAPSFALLPVMTLWANLHGSFMAGLALIVPLALEAVLTAERERGRVATRWALFLLAAIAAAAITPFGPESLIFPPKLMALGGLAHIGEWQAADFSTITPLEIALLATIFVVVSRGIKIPPIRLLLLLGLTHFALKHVRHEMILAVVAPLLLAEPLANGLNEGAKKTTAAVPFHPMIAGVLGLLLAAGLILRLSLPIVRTDGAMTPRTALAHVPPELKQLPLLNDYAFGGYLIFSGIEPFIDSRADLHGDAFLKNYAKLKAGDSAALAHTLQTYRIRWALLEPHTPLTAALSAMPGWHEVYSDNTAAVFTQRVPG